MVDERRPTTRPPQWEDRLEHLQALVVASLAAVDPEDAVRCHLRLETGTLTVGDTPYDLDAASRVLVVGAGKAGVAMARAAVQVLGPRLTGGVMAVPDFPPGDGQEIEWIQGGHPLPTQGSVNAGRRVAEVLASTQPQDVVLALISGGGSALLELPVHGVSLEDLRATTDLLLRSGATIDEVNTVRRRLSKIKGGGLARLAAPARTATLLLSDVVGDRLEAIASGPTFDPRDEPGAGLAVIDRYDLRSHLPDSVRAALEASGAGGPEETPAVQHLIVGNNRMAAEAAARRASELGFQTQVLASTLEGEASGAGRRLAGLAKAIRQRSDPLPAPACLIQGGETTVHVTGDGRGGRNQELALAAAIELEGQEHCLVAAFATDGVDGPTPAAGGIATGSSLERARALGLDPRKSLQQNDSHTFLSRLGDTLATGPTGTNVSDLAFVLVYP
jgi:hydroxypyruvate reductase